MAFDFLSPTTNAQYTSNSSTQNSTSSNYSFAPVTSTNTTQSLNLMFNSPYGSIGSATNPSSSVAPSTSLSLTPSQSASQSATSGLSTDSVSKYILLGGAVLGAFLLFKK